MCRSASVLCHIAFALLAACRLASPAVAAPPTATPTPFDEYLVLMQTGVFDFNAPHPTLPGCFQTFCDGQFFHEVIMGRSPAEILTEEEAARDFFRSRFGADVDDPANAGRLFMTSFMMDPRVLYRVYTWGGRNAPPQGWEVRDGGIFVTVTDPAGFLLGGDFAGLHVPVGTLLFFGNYNFLVTHPNGKPREELVLRYRSVAPVVPNPDGLMIQCELEHPDWGLGLAQVFYTTVPRNDGRTRVNLRNVMTFPGLGNE